MYLSSFEFKYWIRRFGALALIPIVNLKDAWKIITNTLPIPMTNNLAKFITYFIDVWIIGKKGSHFSPEVWNCHECIEHRTNNKLEGYHSKLQKDINSKPDIYTIIRYLKKIDSDENNNYLRRKNFITTNNSTNTRTKDRLKEEKLAKIQKEYRENKISFTEYFDAITMHVIMPYCNDEEADYSKQMHENEQNLYSSHLSDASCDVSDITEDDSENEEKKLKNDIFKNPFKNDSWFYMKKKENILPNTSTTKTASETTETAISPTTTVINITTTNEPKSILKKGTIEKKNKRKQSPKTNTSPKKKKANRPFKQPKHLTINETVKTNAVTEYQTSIKDFLKNPTTSKSIQIYSKDDEVICLGEKLQDFNYFGKIHFNNWIINSNEWLTNGHVNVIQSLMYDKFRYNGFSGFVHPMSMSPRDFYMNPDTIHESAFVTVLNAEDHWVTLTNFNPFYADKMNESGLGIWFMYESLNNHQYYLDKIAPALKRLNIESGEVRVLACNMPKQYGLNDCGLFALAYAIAICESKEPSKLLFQQMAMRDNFNNILKTQELKQFDCYEINDNKLVDYEEYFVNLRDVSINY